MGWAVREDEAEFGLSQLVLHSSVSIPNPIVMQRWRSRSLFFACEIRKPLPIPVSEPFRGGRAIDSYFRRRIAGCGFHEDFGTRHLVYDTARLKK